MTQSNLLKIFSSGTLVAQKMARSITEKSGVVIEDHVLKGKYVTREEFENLRQIVNNLQQQLAVLNKTK